MNKFMNQLPNLEEQNGRENQIKWLRSRDVRKMLGIGDSSLQSFRIRGLIPAYKLGDMWFYREDQINAIMLNGLINTN